MRPLSGIFNISGVCILSTHVRMWRMLIRHRRTRVSESKQTTICENRGKRSHSLPDLYLALQLKFLFPNGIKFSADFLGWCLGCQRYDHDGQCGYKECRKQFINIPGASHRAYQVFPYEYHHAACYHSGQGTLQVSALPEQGEEYQRAECGTEACPCEEIRCRIRSCPGSRPGIHRQWQYRLQSGGLPSWKLPCSF